MCFGGPDDSDDMTEAEAHDDGRLVIEVRDRDGKLESRFFGASTAELLTQHRAGECSATCSWCHQALADKIGEDAAMAVMHERCFGSSIPTVKH